MTPALLPRTLPDSTIWIDHLRRGNARLAALIDGRDALVHDFVEGELAIGHLRRDSAMLEFLAVMPRVRRAEHEEVQAMVRLHRLEGSGIGWVDAHLLASAIIEGAKLWTLDKRLLSVVTRLGVNA